MIWQHCWLATVQRLMMYRPVRLHSAGRRVVRWFMAVVVLSILSGCSALSGAAASRFADGLSAAILDEEDPDLVRDGTPAYLILLDAMVKSDPGNARYLGAAAQLYAAYGVAFVSDETRAQTLTTRAREYGARAICAADRRACHLDEVAYSEFAAIVDRIGKPDAGALYSYCVGSLAFIRTHSQDWAAVAALPEVEHALQHLLAIGDVQNAASINMYLGILSTLRPEALGGSRSKGRRISRNQLNSAVDATCLPRLSSPGVMRGSFTIGHCTIGF